MSGRARVSLTPREAAEVLAAARKVQLATINRDGTPHLVPTWEHRKLLLR